MLILMLVQHCMSHERSLISKAFKQTFNGGLHDGVIVDGSSLWSSPEIHCESAVYFGHCHLGMRLEIVQPTNLYF